MWIPIPTIPRRRSSCSSGLLVLSVIAALAWPMPAWAQADPMEPIDAVRVGGRALIDLGAVSRRYGWSIGGSNGSVTVRTEAGILTVFEDSPDALWQRTGEAEPEVVPLSMPPRRISGGWLVPEDLLEVLGVETTDATVEVPGGVARLSFPAATDVGDGFEVARLGQGMVGLRFFESGPAGADTVSLMLSDLTLLALVVPEHRDILDRVLVDGPLADEHPLLVTVTSVAPAEWESSFVFEQGAVRFEARHPFRFGIVTGSPTYVTPDEPVVGVVLLPARFSLEEPLLVRWSGRVAEVNFRPGR